MVESITKSTLKQYQSVLRKWWDFAHEKGWDVFNAHTTDILSFLSEKFKDDASYGVLNTSRSAIALMDGLITRFLKGVFRQKSTKPKYSSTWDTTSVLIYMENLPPMTHLKLKDATEKLATLLALVTAHRLQTLSVINITNISRSSEGITIKIPDLIKTSKPGSFQGLCVASCVLEYLEITEDLREESNNRLLISSIKPFGSVSPQTIGHWIKSLLAKAGVDTDQFSAYSTRHAAVSPVIRRTAGWSAQSQTFMKYYNRPVQASDNHFASSS
ncbi:hypothetical protein ALC57_14789 [Trachymyrmex cornetzi]|uniref:Tyr recombinase domain-containing protein n=1 Tax=Trachymyrmex cornetzi TaxID=471704 RepID=A0A151IXP8_9HYME|nr:hypothetical protein ALC57_14789 [Trachymyrmex cornetzi]